MSSEVKWLAKVVPKGEGWALDLGGGKGTMRPLVERKGWRYVLLDARPAANGSQMVCGDAQTLPFHNNLFSLIIIKDALEHFWNPWKAMEEIRRVLKGAGTLVIWVPFMHPFHGDDYYRYTPLAIKKLLEGFRIIRFEAPLWIFSVLGIAVTEMLKRMGLSFMMRPIREITWRLDRLLQPQRVNPRSFAGAYLIVAVKEKGF
jgi:SAM-dependent methyltransferase